MPMSEHPPSASKVLLWDIDGTLLHTPGVGVRAFARALETVAGRPMARIQYDFGGKTDPLIARDLLAAVEIDDPSYIPLVLAEVERNYDDLADDLRATISVLPGASELLTRCAQLAAIQTVVTGNIQFVARRKLEAGRLDHHLDLDRGGYGSDHHDRTELVNIALSRLADDVDAGGGSGRGPIERDRVWIIGDTPRDAACALGAGVRCLLVATGTYSLESLAGLGANAVLPDLADVERVLDILMS